MGRRGRPSPGGLRRPAPRAPAPRHAHPWRRPWALLASAVLAAAPVLTQGQASGSNSSNASSATLATLNASIACRPPISCTDYLSDILPCVTVPRTQALDKQTGQQICAAIDIANGGDVAYVPRTGVPNTRCIQDWKRNGRCDMQNDHLNENCEYDGGDCCYATCHRNCVKSASIYSRTDSNCEYFCGEQSSYLCLDDDAVYSPITAWCQYGQIKGISECYYTKLDIASALLECIMDDRAHGNEMLASPQCGNRTLTCTEADVQAQNGCQLAKDECMSRACCTTAVKQGFIDASYEELPTLREIYDRCSVAKNDNDEPCFKYMVKCVQDNRAAKGGCCQCEMGWAGWRCRWPICWPQCVHGNCVAPDMCKCEAGWQGPACSHAICDPKCVPGQGLCVQPNVCECFYGWTGTACETPISVPSCVNGVAVSPDLCRCAPGWGGRLCDYPLCQSWPVPSADCGMGSCVQPYKCECEPGWKLNQLLNSTGYPVKPFWSRGQDISTVTVGTYVRGDSRIAFLSRWDRFYNSSNADKCEIPDCAHVFDPRCVSCNLTACTACEPGFFVEQQSGRCERCSNVFRHCQLCDYVTSGAFNNVTLRCTLCDPLFVLEPVPYGQDPTARCVSDGVIEFSSTVYHVYKNDVNVSLLLQRSAASMEPAFARPVEVLVRTRDGTAKSRSRDYGGGMANFQFSAKRVRFEVDPYAPVPPEGADSPNYTQAVALRVDVEQVINISIYDDVTFFPGLRYFDVDLYLPPEHLMGHQGPLSPFLAYYDFETTTGYLPPMDFDRSPVYKLEALTTARVYIWDREEASAPNTTCRGACMDWQTKTFLNIPRTLTIEARTYQGAFATSPRDRFLVKCVPSGVGQEGLLGVPYEAQRVAATPYRFTGQFAPTFPGKFRVTVEKIVPGVTADYWLHSNVFRNPPTFPDISRIDHRVDYRWDDVSAAPAFARWKFHLHFTCIRTKRWPQNFAHALAVHASPGTTVSIYFQNEGLQDRTTVPMDAEPVEVMDLNRTACQRARDGTRMNTDVADQFLCVELINRDPQVDPNGIYAFMVEMETPKPTLLSENFPAFINIRMYHQNDTEFWAWWPVDQGCLLSSEQHIAGSPFEGFEALSGVASAATSLISTLDVPANYREVYGAADNEVQVRVDLFDAAGRKVLLGPSIIGVGLKAKLSGPYLNQYTGPPEISWDRDRYRISFTPILPPTGPPLSGIFSLDLQVTLDTLPLSNSPFKVWVRVAITDYWKTRILKVFGNYTPMKASEIKSLRLQAYNRDNLPRTTGGDKFWVYFDGPHNDPLPPKLRYEASHIIDNGNGTYDVDFEIQRPGIYELNVCPATLTTTPWVAYPTTTISSTTSTSTTRTSSTSTQTVSSTTSTSTSRTRTTTTTSSTSSTSKTTTSSTSTSRSSTTTSTSTSSTTATTTSTRTSSTTTSTSTFTWTASTTGSLYTSTRTSTRTSTTSTTTRTTTTSKTSTTTTSQTTTTSTSSTSTTTYICIQVKGVHVYDTLAANLTNAYGEGVDGWVPGAPARVWAGRPAFVEVIVRDTYGVQYYEGGANLSLQLEGFNESAGDSNESVDAGDGSYSYNYTICRAGLTHASILLHTQGEWRHIRGSPFPVQVLPTEPDLVASTVDGLSDPAYSGIPTSVLFTIRDACGNLPLLRLAQSLNISLSRLEHGPPSTGPPLQDPDIVESPPGKVAVHFTPARRGLYRFVVLIGGENIAGSPFVFEVGAAGAVPTRPGAPWQLGAIGGSAMSTYEVLDPPTAGVETRVRVISRDLWGDPLPLGNDTFLLSLWRDNPVAACPTHPRCAAFAMDAAECGRLPMCSFDASASACRPLTRCPPARGFSISDPEVAVRVRKVVGSTYEFGVNAPAAGTYRCTASVLRPGGLRFHYYENGTMLERVAEGVVQGPADYNWQHLGPPGVHEQRFDARAIGWAIGWLRVPVQDKYTIWFDSDGAGQLYLNGTLQVNHTPVELQGMAAPVHVELPAGFTPIQIVYHHFQRLFCPLERRPAGGTAEIDQQFWCRDDIGVYLRLTWSSPSVPYQVIPISALYYEEGLVQADNPMEFVVRPMARASAVAIELDHTKVPSLTIGDTLSLRLHTIDALGNMLTRRDVAASVRFSAQPQFARGKWQGDTLVSDRWRLTPMANGSWDLTLFPDDAPMEYNLSFDLRTLEAGGVAFTRRMKIVVQPGDARTATSWTRCLPLSPQLAGTRITCTAVPYDSEGNDVFNTSVKFMVDSPAGITEATQLLPAVEAVARSASFVPTVAGTWVVRAMVLYPGNVTVNLIPVQYVVLPGPTSVNFSDVAMNDTFTVGDDVEVLVTPLDGYRNAVENTDDVLLARLHGGYKEGVDASVQDLVNGSWVVRLPPVESAAAVWLSMQLLKTRHNNTLSHCPELRPHFGRVARLSRYRALGSIALLECLPGYVRAAGGQALRCEANDEGAGEWRDLQHMQASILMCRPQAFWCPILSFANAHITRRDHRREVGSVASLRCLDGYELAMGDMQLVCGTRDGVGAWLDANGDLARPAVCSPMQHHCPPVMGGGAGVYVANMSADRDVTSVAQFGCMPGFRYVAGSVSVYCAGDGEWKRAEQATPLLRPEQFACALVPDFCPDPAPLLGPPELQLVYGSRVAAETGRQVGGNVTFECLEGYKRVVGDTGAVCAVSRADDSRGSWVAIGAAYGQQVDVQPLRCSLVQNWCPELVVRNGLLVGLSHERYLRSIAELACAPGYEQVPGTYTTWRCGLREDNATGAWYSVEDGSPVEQLLRCEKIESYCPQPVPGEGVILTNGTAWEVDSVVGMSCDFGYEQEVPQGLESLRCRPGPDGAGQWVQYDGLPVSPATLTCRAKQDYCPMLSLGSGRVRDVVGERDVVTGAAVIECNTGFRMVIPVPRSEANGWRNEVTNDGPLALRCTPGDESMGIWRDDLERDLAGVRCEAVPEFCPGRLFAFTQRQGVPMPLVTTYFRNQWGRFRESIGPYYVKFLSDNSFGTTARVRCNESMKYHHSFGDEEVYCGYSEDGTRGAWRNAAGRLAIPLHCFYSGTPISDVKKPPVLDLDGCFAPSAVSPLPYRFSRSGAIVFWIRPYDWPVGSMLIQGEQGSNQWQVWFSQPGVLQAQVAPSGRRPLWHKTAFNVDPAAAVGHVILNITQNGTKGFGSWFHVAFVWDLGVGLAGIGRARLVVDGIQSRPYSPNSDTLDSFTWVEPSNLLHIGAGLSRNSTTPGNYSTLRVYGRAPLNPEIDLVRKSEDPRCGFFNGVCSYPATVNAAVVGVSNPHDARFSLFPLRPETQLQYECLPGFVASSGDPDIECQVSGGWVRANTSIPATPIKCCQPAPGFCPTIMLMEGTLLNSSREVALLCEDGEDPPLVEPMNASSDLQLSFLATAALECLDILFQVHGDSAVACGLGPAVSVNCTDAVANWTDSAGRRCSTYRDQEWCTFDGDYGAGWDRATMGDFLAYAHQGHGAGTACCDCGGGNRGTGVGGRWLDEHGDNAEFPICALELHGWCPKIDLTGKNSVVTSYSLGTGYGSVAKLRCKMGFEIAGGHDTLRCIRRPGGGGGWDLPPLECALSRHFCPPLRPVNATPGPGPLNYSLGEVLSLACLRGFTPVQGDPVVRCEVGDLGIGGQWKRLSPLPDDVAGQPLVCAPASGYCAVPDMAYGYVESLSLGDRLGSVAQLRCRSSCESWCPATGSSSPGCAGQTAICLHDDEPASPGDTGAFYMGLSYTSRDLLRAVSVVHDVLSMLEVYLAQAHRPEDDNATRAMQFERHWQAELNFALAGLPAGADVAAALQRIPGYSPGGPDGSRLAQFTVDHVRMLDRLLLATVEERHDISTEQARAWYGAHDKLQVSFQDDATLAPPGWLRDSGEPFGYRANGFRYGWKCDVSPRSANPGAFNRNRSGYTDLENTLVVSDPYSNCAGQEWRIELPRGRYYVEVVVQDPQLASNASGCQVQGELLRFPETPIPPGGAVRRGLFADVVDSLIVSCDGDSGCSSISRITMQPRADVNSRGLQRPQLQCQPLYDWCPPLALPPHTLASRPEAVWAAQPPGAQVKLSCDTQHVYSYGLTTYVSGWDDAARGGLWRAPGGGKLASQPPIACVRNRTWCPPMRLLNDSRLVAMDPPTREIGSVARIECRRGFAPAGGASAFRCMESGDWCPLLPFGGGNCSAGAQPLECVPVPDYCPDLRIASAERVVPYGFLGEDEPQVHSTTVLTTMMPVAAAPLGTIARSGLPGPSECPAGFQRAHGDVDVVCGHGPGSSGAWKPAAASAALLVDAAEAERVVCELGGAHGAQRRYYTTAGLLHVPAAGAGVDVVPSIDQLQSEYDAAHFEAHLRIPVEAEYAFGVEVVGKFVLAFMGEVLLTGRSRGAAPELFVAPPVYVKAGYQPLSVQYELDPLLAGLDRAALVARHVRLLWRADNVSGMGNWTAVPATALFHTFRELAGFPRVVHAVDA